MVKILGAECTTRVLSGEKDTEFEKRNYLSGIVVFQPSIHLSWTWGRLEKKKLSVNILFLLDLGSAGEELSRIYCYSL